MTADGLRFPSQIAATQTDASGSRNTVWALSLSGHLMARRADALGVDRWTDFGTSGGNDPCDTELAATSWVSGGIVHERVFCVNALNSRLLEFGLDNGVATGWSSHSNPGGYRILSQIAASSAFDAGEWWVYVFATTTTQDLWVRKIDQSAPLNPSWQGLNPQGGYSFTSHLAASRGPGATPTYARVYAARTDGTIQVVRRVVNGWQSWNIGRPELGINVMGAAGAAEDQLDASGSYKAALFCTSASQSNRLYEAVASSSAAGAAYSWTWRTLGPYDGQFLNYKGTIAATTRSDGGSNRAIEAFALASQTSNPPNRIWRLRRTTLGLGSLVDIGADGETGERSGGLAAYAAPTPPVSQIFFLGSGTGVEHEAVRLYRKNGADTNAADPWNWTNCGNGFPWNQLPGGDLTRAETSASFFDGNMAVVAMARAGDGGSSDYPRVQFLHSQSDGDSWFDPWRDLPDAGYESHGDPTVDFDEDGTAYITVLGIHWPNGQCSGTIDIERSAVYFVTTPDGGATFSPPTFIAEANGFGFDHPWMAIHRDPAGAGDRVHFVWDSLTQNDTLYASMEPGGAVDGPHSLFQAWGLTGGFGPYVSVGANGVAYVSSSGNYCRIRSDHQGCEDAPQPAPATIADEGDLIRTQAGATADLGSSYFLASPTNPDVIYRLFHRKETDGPGPDPDGVEELDVYVAVGTYDPPPRPPGALPFTWSGPIPIADASHYNDDADQFQPTMTASRDADSQGNLFASWYDRHATNCGTVNRCYRARSAVSKNAGANFLYQQNMQIDSANSLMDPDELPNSCIGDDKFLGHYRASRGDLLHTRHVISGPPDGGASPESLLSTGWMSGGFYYW